MVLVDGENRMAGLVSRRDCLGQLIIPPGAEKQRIDEPIGACLMAAPDEASPPISPAASVSPHWAVPSSA